MEIKKQKAVWFVIFTMVSAMAAVLLYIFLHELGHCIVAAACGAEISQFSILAAHMSYTGGNYTKLSDLCLHANGMVFPLIVSNIYMLLYKKKPRNSFYCILSFFIVLIPIASAFAWVFVPIVYMMGNAPAGDDVTKFLNKFSSVHSPVWVSVAALMLIIISVMVMIKKRILQNYLETLKSEQVK